MVQAGGPSEALPAFTSPSLGSRLCLYLLIATGGQQRATCRLLWFRQPLLVPNSAWRALSGPSIQKQIICRGVSGREGVRFTPI